MRFWMMEADNFYTLSDPLMAAGTLYGCIWLFLALFFVLTRYRSGSLPPIWAAAIMILVGSYLEPRGSVLAFINILLPLNISLGMFGGGPPFWVSLVSAASGASAGWFVQRRRERSARRSEAFARPDSAGHAVGQGRLPALVLSLIFPGLGQAYCGNPFRGLAFFFGLTMMIFITRVSGFAVGYTLIQVDMLMRPSLIDRILKRLNWASSSDRPASGSPGSPVN